jgi:hypothetical protein
MCSYSLSLSSTLDGMVGQSHALAPLPLGKAWYHLYRRRGRPQRRSVWVSKISRPQLGCDPQTVYRKTNHCNNYVIAKDQLKLKNLNLISKEFWPRYTTLQITYCLHYVHNVDLDKKNSILFLNCVCCHIQVIRCRQMYWIVQWLRIADSATWN